MLELSKPNTSTNLTAKLPADLCWSPIRINSQGGQNITVLDCDGRRIAILSDGQSATFVVKAPKWWEWWKRPRWSHSNEKAPP